MNMLNIKKLDKTYDGKTYALKSMNLTITKGMFGILGRNGSGKSTLMNIIATILTPSNGTLTINDISIREPQKIRKMTGYLPQDFDFYPNMKVLDVLYYLGFVSKMSKKDLDFKIEKVLNKVNLTERKYKKVKSLSGGMKKRLGIEQAILHNPDIIIVDEPTAGLDPEERIRLRQLLSKLAEDKIVLISTHIVSDIESTCDNIGILEKGQLVYQGNINEFIRLSDNYVYEITISPSQLEYFKKNDLFITKIHEFNNQLTVKFISIAIIDGSRKVKPDFEDAYMYFLKKYQGGFFNECT